MFIFASNPASVRPGQKGPRVLLTARAVAAFLAGHRGARLRLPADRPPTLPGNR